MHWLPHLPAPWSPPEHLHAELRDPKSWFTDRLDLTTGEIAGERCIYVTRFVMGRLCDALEWAAPGGGEPTVFAASDGKGHTYPKLHHPELERRAKLAGVPPNSFWFAPVTLAVIGCTDYHARSAFITKQTSDYTLFNLTLRLHPTYTDPDSGEEEPARRSRSAVRIIRDLMREYDVQRYGVAAEDDE